MLSHVAPPIASIQSRPVTRHPTKRASHLSIVQQRCDHVPPINCSFMAHPRPDMRPPQLDPPAHLRTLIRVRLYRLYRNTIIRHSCPAHLHRRPRSCHRRQNAAGDLVGVRALPPIPRSSQANGFPPATMPTSGASSTRASTTLMPRAPACSTTNTLPRPRASKDMPTAPSTRPKASSTKL